MTDTADDVRRMTVLAHALTTMTERTGDLPEDEREAVFLIACEILDAGRRIEAAEAA